MTADRFHLLKRELRNAELTSAQRIELMELINEDAMRSVNAYANAKIAIDRARWPTDGEMTATGELLKAGR